MSVVDDKLGTWRRVTEQAEPPAELLARVLAPAPQRRAKPIALTAAERAGVFRRGGFGAWRLKWQELGRWRFAAALPVLLAVAGAVGVYASHLPERHTVRPEPSELIANVPVEESFGLGEGVMYERLDQKVFDFAFRSPVKMVAVLHFQARDISTNEVVISVNGTDVGFVPPDTLAVNERSNEALIPSSVLLRGGRTNKIVFDNVKNPPGRDTWRLWNVWVEVFPLPELGRESLVLNAQEDLRRAQDFWDRRSVGAENLYKAWRASRDAWLTLESLEGPKPIEYTVARDKMREAQVSMDRLCAQLLLEAQSAYNNKQYEPARRTLEHVNEFFPKRDQACPFRAEQMREYFGI